MIELDGSINEQYQVALRGFLAGDGEVALQSAYQLGRRAIADGLGVIDLAGIHHQALLEVLGKMKDDGDRRRAATAAGGFLAESLSPFEITHRGYQEVSALVRHTLEFAAAVCHELRTPLTSIRASAGMLREVLDPEPTGEVDQLLANILSGASSLNSRMNDLVDMAGFQSGRLSVQLEPIDLGSLLLQICQNLEPIARHSGLELIPRIPEALPLVRGDPLRLEQVVSNLVHNAIRFGFEGGRIDIRARSEGSQILIAVQDYGQGISPQDQAKLFRPFERGRLRGKGRPGLGIGLALCKQLVEAHNGRIWVNSELGSGATFHVSLPLFQPPTTAARPG